MLLTHNSHLQQLSPLRRQQRWLPSERTFPAAVVELRQRVDWPAGELETPVQYVPGHGTAPASMERTFSGLCDNVK